VVTLRISVLRKSTFLFAMPFVMVIAGCGGDDGPKVHLNGIVTYDGQPIPRGQIMFAPDTSKGNSGPGSAAVIENGKYTTRDGLATVGGAHVVRIEGFDGVADGENIDGGLLFPTYTIEVDLPTTSGEKNFTVEKQP